MVAKSAPRSDRVAQEGVVQSLRDCRAVGADGDEQGVLVDEEVADQGGVYPAATAIDRAEARRSVLTLRSGRATVLPNRLGSRRQ